MRSEGLAGLTPDWPAPAGVGAWMSTRAGGVSAAPWQGLNLGIAVGDEPAAVAENRRRFAEAIGATPVWLRQVHGRTVARLTAADAGRAQPIEADAAITTERGIACTVQVADCLPVLFCAPEGRAVGAAHAGWRGLAGGVLDATVAALCEATGCAPAELQAWLGPCIGPRQFEVGEEVVLAFGGSPAGDGRFTPRPRPDGAMRWLADLPALARDRLRQCGVSATTGGAWCTVEDPSRFFSYRRDGVTGRLAAAIWRR
ncbi:peptidoglycan editing factor PgeF [Aquincola tertiaricarbonis]|uniref:Purine nucleoside phosphorylase n=1 Tax=Aquincola tertiaricarbonis TaxID=391953 RepID=A0ABY4SH96_AQUTE|nr:peptidoglycan editing factor PgeF [Aquincola tertiaricarbonis]URI11163.1 peptidoglycan editing factor PgeF [Aquincola tertiaricarbonis]